jgi:iron complex outermembrane receptor protein
VEEGRPVGQFFMLKCDGLTADGQYNLVDVNGDGQVTEDDRTYVGSAQPDLTFGWNHSFSYKKWDASFFLRGTIGNDVFNAPIAQYGNTNNISGSNVINNDKLRDLKGSVQICSYYLEDGSFARLDNLSIGYTFDTKKVSWLDRARVYVAAQNLFVLTGYSGIDPEVELFRDSATDDDAGLSPGIEHRYYYPKPRSFTIGVNITF